MALHKLLESMEGATLTVGFITKTGQDGTTILVSEKHDNFENVAPRAETWVPLQGISLRELGIMKTTPNYLLEKKHPIILFRGSPVAVPHEVYDGITGKPIYIESKIPRRV